VVKIPLKLFDPDCNADQHQNRTIYWQWDISTWKIHKNSSTTSWVVSKIRWIAPYLAVAKKIR